MDYRNAARVFGILDRRSQNYIVLACEKLQLTFLEYVLLRNLYDHEGIRQEDMAALMSVDKAVVARTIKLLEAKGLVRRVQGQRDKREKCIYVTDAGKAQEVFLRDIVRRWIDYLTEGLDAAAFKALLQSFSQLAARAQSADFEQILKGKNVADRKQVELEEDFHDKR